MICTGCGNGVHGKCKGNTFCDCQHRVRDVPKQAQDTEKGNDDETKE